MKRILTRPFPWRSSITVRLFLSPAASPEASTSASPPACHGVTTASPSAGKKSDERLLYRRLSVLGGAKDGSVHKTLNKWVGQGNRATAIDLMNCVKELRKYKRYSHALEIMDWMVNVRGMNMSHSNHAIRIDLMYRVNGIESAENYFSNLPDSAKTAETYGALFSCYCVDKRVDKLFPFFEKMKELNFASNGLVLTNLMGLYSKLEQHDKVPGLLQHMKENNIVPGNIAYCIVMNSYAALKDISSVERIIQEMEEDRRIVVQWSAYSTLASIYISVNDFEKAEKALKKVEGLANKDDREPFHYLISLYASMGNLEGVKRTWKSFKQNFAKVANASYLIMLRSLSKLNDAEGLKECYEEWELAYKWYDVKLTNAVLSCYLKNDMIEESESLYAKTKEKVGRLDFRTCELFMDYYLKKSEMDLALKWLEEAANMIKNREWKVDAGTVNLLLKHFENKKDLNGLENFCKISEKLDCIGPDDFELLKWVKEEDISLKPKVQKLLDDKVFESK